MLFLTAASSKKKKSHKVMYCPIKTVKVHSKVEDVSSTPHPLR